MADKQDGPSGSYTDESGLTHNLDIINQDPSITFEIENDVHNMDNETAYKLVAVTYDGWRAHHIPNAIWERIILFCQGNIK